MNRRNFFGALLGGAAALAADPERALWTPGAKKIFIPKALPPRGAGLFIKVGKEWKRLEALSVQLDAPERLDSPPWERKYRPMGNGAVNLDCVWKGGPANHAILKAVYNYRDPLDLIYRSPSGSIAEFSGLPTSAHIQADW
jgi:hypothetical protein